jgi:hypothetical protein
MVNHHSIQSTRSGKAPETDRSIQWGLRGRYVCTRRLNDLENVFFERVQK